MTIQLPTGEPPVSRTVIGGGEIRVICVFSPAERSLKSVRQDGIQGNNIRLLTSLIMKGREDDDEIRSGKIERQIGPFLGLYQRLDLFIGPDNNGPWYKYLYSKMPFILEQMIKVSKNVGYDCSLTVHNLRKRLLFLKRSMEAHRHNNMIAKDKDIIYMAHLIEAYCSFMVWVSMLVLKSSYGVAYTKKDIREKKKLMQYHYDEAMKLFEA